MFMILRLCRQKGAIEGASLALADFATCLMIDPRIQPGMIWAMFQSNLHFVSINFIVCHDKDQTNVYINLVVSAHFKELLKI